MKKIAKRIASALFMVIGLSTMLVACGGGDGGMGAPGSSSSQTNLK
ncbi:MAG: hypothetical protein V3U75_02035 [Methylococcaceae bacterium]